MNEKSILEDFLVEMEYLNSEIADVLKKLNEDLNQPAEFLKFSQLVDRIYGTAMTLGYKDLGKYTGDLKNISRKCGNTGIRRSQKPILGLMMNYVNNFQLLIESVKYSDKIKDFNFAISLDIKKMAKLEQEIFDFADKDSSMIKIKRD